MPKFTHLHVHTEYSLLDGSSKIKEIVARAAELGMDSLAITDHGVMYGVIDFYKAAQAQGIKPILGCEVYVAPHSRLDKKGEQGENKYNHLILLAENNKGYENLMKIVSIGFTEGFYYKPRVDYEVLEKYHEGIIATSACLAGEVQRALAMGMYEEGKNAALRLNSIFGDGNFFLELQDHGISQQKYVNKQLIELSKETGIELVCTNDVHYTRAEDAEAHDVLLCIQTNALITDENRMRYPGGQFYLKSPEEMAELFPEVPEALENTVKIAERCNVDIKFGETKVPRYDYPKEYETSEEYLRMLCKKGFEERYPKNDNDEQFLNELTARLETELSVISGMGYVDYFLIVWDFINFARENNIAVGPGRGSASGSIVSYCLKITDIDPIKNDLVFERFLNPERVSMPDIDIDFCYERRQEVIDYVVNKYGHDCVSQIITFGTMMARAVIKDVGRAMDIPYARRDQIAKMIPSRNKITIDEAMEENPELKKLYETDSEARDLIDKSKKLEGLPRHASVHAAGVLICDKPVYDYVPLAVGADNAVVAQFTMVTLEKLGLLKMDFLALRTLTVIRDAVEMVREKRPDFDIEKVPLDDRKVYDYISTGKCEGIFQLESAGMKNFMKRLKPESLDDLIAGIALFRPGPMDFIPKYIDSKNNPEKVTYDCPQLEPILKSTYGCMVYQEQVMQIVRDLAGYSWGRSDLVRRAMSKKQADVMEQERRKFIFGSEEDNIAGCVNNGVSEEIAGRIFDEMTEFANYAFNKAHAAGYAIVSYRTAYLKTYYPAEYMAALMTSVIDRSEKIAEYTYACQQMGIKLLPPDINNSGMNFKVKDGNITFALSEIKSLGKPTVKAIIKEREDNGPYVSLYDFIRRVGSNINKRSVEYLIKSGTLDTLSGTRKGKLAVYEDIMDQVSKQNKDSISGQMSLFDMFSDNEGSRNSFEITVPDIQEFSVGDMLSFEKEILGIYISGHPLDEYTDEIAKTVTAYAVDFVKEERNEDSDNSSINIENQGLKDKSRQIIGGVVTDFREITTKKDDLMGFATIEDKTGEVEIVVFPSVYRTARKYLQLDSKIFIEGDVSTDSDSSSKLLVSKIYPMGKIAKKLWIRFESKEEYYENKSELTEMVNMHNGSDEVIVYCNDIKKMLKFDVGVDVNENLVNRLSDKFGVKNVVVK